ncbi:MAG: sugar phosphate isomerase/epimerase [Armatimonadetes bacterium]|nr:sugar phosphate isomerase/epimerase [Armatimonadota bacterium]
MEKKYNRRDALAAGAMFVGGIAGSWAASPAHSREKDRPKQSGQAKQGQETPGKEGRTKMKLGLVSYNVAKDWDLPTVLKNCAAAGVEGFEARTTHAHGIEPSLSTERRKEIRRQFADAGVTLWGLGTTCEFHSPDPDVVKRNIETCKEFVRLAQDLGVKGVKVRPNGLRKDVPPETTLKQIADALRPCGDYGRERGVEIWVEVHGAETQKPANMHRIFELTDHPNVGACWNSNRTDIEDGGIGKAFDLLRPWILSVHINDLWGDYPYRDLFRRLNASGYDRYTLCEVGAPIAPDSGATFLKCYGGLWEALQR